MAKKMAASAMLAERSRKDEEIAAQARDASPLHDYHGYSYPLSSVS
jgi:hypothetical protein